MSDGLCKHKAEHKEVLGHVLCVCCSHCQNENARLRSALEKAREALETLAESSGEYLESNGWRVAKEALEAIEKELK